MERAATVTDDYEVAAALRVAIGLVVRKMRQAHLPGELTIAETSALSRLDRGGRELMGATLAALEQRDLMERRRDPADGRRVVLSITAAGRQLVNDRRGARSELIAAALRDGFTAAERDLLLAAAPLLERLAEKL